MDAANTGSYRALTDDINHHLASLRRKLPDVMQGFNDLGPRLVRVISPAAG